VRWQLLFVTLAFALVSQAQAAEGVYSLAEISAVITQVEPIAEATNHVPGSEHAKLRLADLYSEKARLLDEEAGRTNCVTCRESEAYRRKAIGLYSNEIKQQRGETRIRILLQLAHLHQTLGNLGEARKNYKTVLKSHPNREASVKALIGIADLDFTQGNYSAAIKLYRKARPQAEPKDQAYVHYRSAWCLVNLSKDQQALNELDSGINLAKALGLNSFWSDLMRDYATILARKGFNEAQIDAFIAKAPVKEQSELLSFLGSEADRLGNKRGSSLIWARVALLKSTDDEDKVAGFMKLAQSHYDLNQLSQTLKDLANVEKRIRKGDCKACENVQNDFRALLITWNKKEKTSPSRSLLSAYEVYLRCFEDDAEVYVWSAQVASEIKEYQKAFQLYLQGARVLSKKGHKSSSGGLALEPILTLAIENAENTRDPKFKEQALREYLDINPNGSQAALVEYQLIYALYEQKQYKQAAEGFRRLALKPNWPDQSQRVKAADLSLDSYKFLGDEEAILKNSKIYAELFLNERTRFLDIHRRTAVNSLAVVLNQNNGNETQLEGKLKSLEKAPTSGAKRDDLIKRYRNLIVGYERLGEPKAVRINALKLLEVKGISESDRQFSYEGLLWASEVTFEFAEAYRWALKSKSIQSKSDKDLRLGLLAELAGKPADQHYRRYLKAHPRGAASVEIRSQLILKKRNPWPGFFKELKYFSGYPNEATLLALEIFAKSPSATQLRKFTKQFNSYRSSPDATKVARLLSRQDASDLRYKIIAQKLRTRSDRQLQRDIKARLKMISELQSLYQQISISGDLIGILESQDHLAAVYSDFKRDILRLPSPKGLKAQERRLYRQILETKANQYQAANEEIRLEKVRSKDALKKGFSEILATASSSVAAYRELGRYEFGQMKKWLSSSQVRAYDKAQAKVQGSHKELVKAQARLRERPLDPARLEGVLEVAQLQGNGPLIAFIDERMKQIDERQRR